MGLCDRTATEEGNASVAVLSQNEVEYMLPVVPIQNT
jgi:hypothetical protein